MTLLEYNSISKESKSNLQNRTTLPDIPELNLPADFLIDFYPNLFCREEFYYFEKYSHRKGDNFHLSDSWFQKLIACLYGRNSKTNLTFCRDITIDELSFTYLVNKYYKESGEDIFHFGEPYWKY